MALYTADRKPSAYAKLLKFPAKHELLIMFGSNLVIIPNILTERGYAILFTSIVNK